VTTDFTPKFDAAWDIALEPGNTIVLAGQAAGRGGRFAIARYDTGGALDSTFSSDGKATTNFTSKFDFALGLARQTDGNLVLAGGSGWGGSNPKVALARYLGA
jgi:Domain of unknown function (DUF5122) beta-propeller